MPSNHLILCHPLLLLPSIFPSIRVFSNELAGCIRWSKYWSFRLSISPSNEYSRLISFRIDWLDLFAVQETLKSLLQHNSKASVLWDSAVFMVQLFNCNSVMLIFWLWFLFFFSSLFQWDRFPEWTNWKCLSILRHFILQVVLQVWCISLHFYYMCVLVDRLCLTLCAPWTGACQAPLSMEFSRQEYWNGLPCHSPTFLLILFKFNIYVATTVCFVSKSSWWYIQCKALPCCCFIFCFHDWWFGHVCMLLHYVFFYLSYACGFFAVSFWKLQGFFTNTEHVFPTRSHAGCEPRRKVSSSKPVLAPPPGCPPVLLSSLS